jgi:hypothetical protein
MLSKTTPRTSALSSTAACNPATPPTELHIRNAGSPTTSFTNARNCDDQFSKL